jgi:hypothetical protein
MNALTTSDFEKSGLVNKKGPATAISTSFVTTGTGVPLVFVSKVKAIVLSCVTQKVARSRKLVRNIRGIGQV